MESTFTQKTVLPNDMSNPGQLFRSLIIALHKCHFEQLPDFLLLSASLRRLLGVQ